MRILIGTPAIDGKTSAWYTHAYGEAKMACAHARMECTALILCYDSSLHSARNELVGAALQNNFDRLLFIDADQGFEGAWVPQIARWGLDARMGIVGAAVIKKSDAREDYNVLAAHPRVDAATGLAEVEGIGCGFTCWTREALQLVWNDSPAYVKDGKHLRMVFTHEIVKGEEQSEDIVACRKARELGVRVWVDPSMDPIHVGPKDYRGNFQRYLEHMLKANGSAGEPQVRKKSRSGGKGKRSNTVTARA